ncbi:MAG TPA: ATP-binding protein [Vicinamibacterales bacterium]|nr:ATP-binding protein [Vicinamibacterales bacterium]
MRESPILLTVQRYLLALAISLIALLVRLVMAPLWETTAPFALFMFATVVTAWFAGRGPALLTGTIGLLTRLYFDSARGPDGLPTTWEEAVRLTLFAGFVVGVAIVLNRMREDRRALEESIVAARREIVERRKAEAELHAARASAEAASRLKDEFLGLVSHELRTPLNAILGWVALMQNGALPPDRTAYALEIVKKNARGQAQLIDDLLDIARGLTGQLQIKPTTLDLAMVVRAVVDAARGVADSRRIRIDVTVDRTPLIIAGDLSRMQQVVGNLLSNAIKFTPDGGQIDIALTQRDGHAEIVVTDTGDGIEPGFAPYLFEPFRQAETGSTRQHGGLGLGLALVRHLVELHGGSVDGQAAGPDGGARFTVRLPLDDDSPRTTLPATGSEGA